eukprot:ANDGO_02607.mRNA.1 Conserved oligomeric Golgi complex subunit 4
MTSLDEASRLILADLDAKLAASEEDIQRLLSRDAVRLQASWGLAQYRIHVEDVIDRSLQLSDFLNSASSMTERVNARMRLLDAAQRGASAAFQRVSDIADLKSCVDGLQNALAMREMASAATYAQRFLKMGPAVQDDANAGRLQLLVDEGASIALSNVQHLLNEGGAAGSGGDGGGGENDAARSTFSEESETRFFEAVRIACLFGKGEDVLRQYSERLQRRVKSEAAWIKDDANAETSEERHSHLVDLLDVVASIIETEEPRATAAFANASLVHRVIEDLQKLVDALAAPELRKLSLILDSIPTDDPKHMDLWLESISVFSRQVELFDAFLREKLDRKHAVSQLRESMVSVMASFVQLSERYLNVTVSRMLSEVDNEYYVDDVFFVVQTAQRRAIESMNSNVLATVVASIAHLLSDVIVPEIVRRGQWNSLEQCAKYATMLVEDLGSSKDQLGEAYADVSRSCTSILHKHIRALAKEFFDTKALILLVPFEKMQFQLDDQLFSLYEAEDPFVSQFTSRLTKLLEDSGISHTLSEDNYDFFLLSVIDILVRRLEKLLFGKAGFTQLGGLQLDKDVRNLSNFFASLCKSSVRDRFQRLSLIASLLSIDKLSEFRDYYSGKSSILDGKDVKLVLRLRVDFGQQAVDRLKV